MIEVTRRSTGATFTPFSIAGLVVFFAIVCKAAEMVATGVGGGVLG